MNFCLFIFSLAVIFGPNYTASATPRSDNAPRSSEFQPQLPSRNNGRKKFTELNLDVLSLIFDNLRFKDIINVAEASPRLSSLAAEVLRIKNDNINIETDFICIQTLMASKKSIQNILSDSKIDNYETFELVLKTLKHFGHMFQRLSIQMPYEPPNIIKIETITTYINKYTTKSVREFTWWGNSENSFESFTVPFEAVEELYIGIKGQEMKQPKVPFNKLFPNLRTLHWVSYGLNYTFLECEFPHLQRVKLYADSSMRENHFFKLLEKNPQVKELTVKQHMNSNRVFNLKRVSQLLPHIENLGLVFVQLSNELTRFENVKTFTCLGFIAIDKLSFGSLESLRIDRRFAYKFDLWREFFQRNTNLSSLHVNVRMKAEFTQLIEVTRILPNLTKLLVNQEKLDINDDIVGKLIESNGNLREIEIQVSELKENDYIALHNKFRTEWYVQCIENERQQSIVLEKIN